MADKQKSNRVLKQENRKWPVVPVEIPRSDWPPDAGDDRAVRTRVLRSREFFIQIFEESGVVRITVNRTLIDNRGRWKSGISWDDLQQIKAWCGYGDSVAVEIFPPDADIIDVANMRHIWILNDPLPFVWKGTSA